MVDDVEFENMECDRNRETPVSVDHINGSWRIFHDNSFTPAFSKTVNNFETRELAISFAESHDCRVTRLQSYRVNYEHVGNGGEKMINDNIRSVIIANEAIVIPIAKEPVFPTNILP